MNSHELKSWPENFQPVAALLKKCELRINDRNYQVGDVIYLREWVPEGRELYDLQNKIRLSVGEYSGDWLKLVISHIQPVGDVIKRGVNKDFQLVLKEWVILSFDYGVQLL